MSLMRFANIPGLEEEKKMVHKLAMQERVPHALLFLGEYGAGAFALVLAFARLVLCDAPEEGEPCEKCPACVKSGQWVHPDLHFSYPVIGSKQTSQMHLPVWREMLKESVYFTPPAWFARQDASARSTGNINVDECHAIMESLSYTAVEGKYKILLLWGAEFLGKEGNRLLKILEEPPEKTLFLLIGANASRILPTILSRCQTIRVRKFKDHEVAEALMAQGLASTHDAEMFAYLADGNLHQAIQLTSMEDMEMEQQFLHWMRQCYAAPGQELNAINETLSAATREELKCFMEYGLHFIRQMLYASAGLEDQIRLPENAKSAAVKMSKVVDFPRIQELQVLFEKALSAIERNAHAKILITHTAIQIHALFRNKMRYQSVINF